jgi:hypothetical protein
VVAAIAAGRLKISSPLLHSSNENYTYLQQQQGQQQQQQ